MLNNFKNCPVCNTEIIKDKTFYCGLAPGGITYHFMSVPESYEEVCYDDYYLLFEPDYVAIDFEDDDSKSCVIEDVAISFEELNTKEKCLMVAENYLLME